MDDIKNRLEAQSIVLALIGSYLCKIDPIFETTVSEMLNKNFSDNELVDESIKAELRNLLNSKTN